MWSCSWRSSNVKLWAVHGEQICWESLDLNYVILLTLYTALELHKGYTNSSCFLKDTFGISCFSYPHIDFYIISENRQHTKSWNLSTSHSISARNAQLYPTMAQQLPVHGSPELQKQQQHRGLTSNQDLHVKSY